MPDENESGDKPTDPPRQPPPPSSISQIVSKSAEQTVSGETQTSRPAKDENLPVSRKELHWLEKLNIFGQCGLVIVGVVAASIYGCQLKTMNRQLTEMIGSGKQTNQLICLYRQQLSALQRQTIDTHGFSVASTYQAVAMAQSESAHIMPSTGDLGIKPDQQVEIPYNLTNLGKTRAEKVRFSADATVWPRNEGSPVFFYSKDSAKLESESMAAGEKSSNVNGGVLGVRVLDQNGHPITWDAKLTNDYQAGTKDIVMWGKLTYFDVFGVKHWSHFCKVFDKHQPAELIHPSHIKCAGYNRSDKNQILASGKVPLPASELIPEIPCPVPDEK